MKMKENHHRILFVLIPFLRYIITTEKNNYFSDIEWCGQLTQHCVKVIGSKHLITGRQYPIINYDQRTR